MIKEDLIKLAEIAKKDKPVILQDEISGEYSVFYFNEDLFMELPWEPNLNITQAFEVLEGWRKLDIKNEAFIKVRSDYNGGDYCVSLTTANVGSGRLPEAICQAVLKARGEG